MTTPAKPTSATWSCDMEGHHWVYSSVANGPPCVPWVRQCSLCKRTEVDYEPWWKRLTRRLHRP